MTQMPRSALPRRLVLIWAICCPGCGDSETYIGVERIKTPLIDGFESYTTIAYLQARRLSSLKWTVLEKSNLPKGDPRPPFGIFRICVSEFVHLQEHGQLELTFFNDRLQSTSFYPEDLDAYLTALEKAGISINEGQELTLPPYTEVWCSRDYLGRPYVAWIDKRLLKQEERWISRYASADTGRFIRTLGTATNGSDLGYLGTPSILFGPPFADIAGASRVRDARQLGVQPRRRARRTRGARRGCRWNRGGYFCAKYSLS